MGYRNVTRHIQFKTTMLGGKTDAVKINAKLMDKPSGCVLWIVVTRDLVFDHYLWFGGEPGKPLPDISANMIAKHSKGTSLGKKNERPMDRVIAKGKFERILALDLILRELFGQFP